MGKNDAVFVDVGGTRTRIWVRNSSGRTLKKTSFPSARSDLKTALRRYLQRHSPHPVELTVGMRGVWTAAEKNRAWRRLRILAGRVRVISDIEFAHERTFDRGPGIILNAGTGSIAYGRSPGGKIARAGGLGPLRGDEGSGFWIGKKGSSLTFNLVRRSVGLTRLKVRLDPFSVSRVAAVALNVVARAQKGNPRCLNIIDEAQDHRVILAKEVRRKLRWRGAAPLALVGGLIENRFFEKRFRRKLRRASPGGFAWTAGCGS